MIRDCRRARALVDKLFDGEASSDERREAESHLEICAACRSHLEFLASLAEGALARDPAAHEPPEAYWDHLPRKILNRIGSESVPRSRRFLRWLLAPGALRWSASSVALLASLALLVAVGLRFVRESPWSGARKATTEQRASTPIPRQAEATAEARREPDQAKEPARSEPDSEALPSVTSESPSAPGARSASVRPPMARDEKIAANRAQDTESVEVADAARASVDTLAASPPPAPSRKPDTATARTRGGANEQAAPASAPPSPSASVAGIREERQERANAPDTRPASASIEAFRSDESDCSSFRAALARFGVEAGETASDNEDRKSDLRYRLARCSVDRYRREGGETLRKAAIEDGNEFLTHEPRTLRAGELRAELERMRPRDKKKENES